jgi:uncharacterized membrane protein YcaP (DUF421 family)
MLGREVFFNGWDGVVRVAVLAVAGYAALILMLRLTRQRSLAQLNVFDFVYVVVIGELLAITILDERISFAEGLTGLVVMIGLQLVISWITTRSKSIERVMNGEPTLVMRRGQFLRDAMQAQRLTESEILAAVREEGVADLADVEAVVLETNGAFSVIHLGAPSRASSLRDVPSSEAMTERVRQRPISREPVHGLDGNTDRGGGMNTGDEARQSVSRP